MWTGSAFALRRAVCHTRLSHCGPIPDKRMSKEEGIEVTGTIIERHPGGIFSVELDDKHKVLAQIAGKLRKHRIRILTGDRVNVELSPYDLTRGRIVYRYRS